MFYYLSYIMTNNRLDMYTNIANLIKVWACLNHLGMSCKRFVPGIIGVIME